MKKTAIPTLFFALILLLSACGSQNETPAAQDYVQLADLDITQCVSAVTYKGLSTEKGDAALTDAEFETGLNNFLTVQASDVQVTDRAVKDGDTVSLSYEATDGNKVITDFWQDNAELTIGSGSTFPEFENVLVGKSCGEDFTVNVTLPESVSKDYGGKAVTVMVQIDYIVEKDVPKLTDDFVKTLDVCDCKTVDEFKTAYRAYLQKSKEAYMESTYKSDLWDKVMATAELTNTGVSYVDSFCRQKQDECISAAENAGAPLDDFTVSKGYDDGAALLAAVKESAEKQARTTVVMYYIAKAEGLSYTDDEYYDAVDIYAYYLGYDSTADMINALGVESIKQTVGDSLIYDKVQTLVADIAA